MAEAPAWLHQRETEALASLLQENRTLRAQLDHRPLRLTDDQRRRLAVLATMAIQAEPLTSTNNRMLHRSTGTALGRVRLRDVLNYEGLPPGDEHGRLLRG